MLQLRKLFEPMARTHGLSFSIAPDPQAPYTAILNGGAGGMVVLVYAGQARFEPDPVPRVPVGSRFELFVSASAALSADKAGGGGLFREDSARKPLYAICEEFETAITGFELPDNDGTVEKRAYYDGTDPAVMPDGFVLNAYKIAFRFRRALI
jgi:hypothetical protein